MSSNVFMNNQLERIADYIDAGKAGATATATVNFDFSNVGDMTGATAGTAGTHGLVPAPAAGDQDKTLHGDGSWRVDPADLPQVFGSGSGSIITLTDAADYAASDLVIDIDSVQSGSGNPSPDNIRPISGWTGANVVVSPTLNAQDGTTYSITFPFEAGTVCGGTLDVVNGVLRVTYIKKTYSGSSSDVQEMVSYQRFLMKAPNCKNISSGTPPIKCNILKPNARISVEGGDYRVSIWSSSTLVFHITSSITSIALLDEWLAENNVEVMYPLATPINYQLTPTEVQMLLGTNNIWADTGDIITLEYVKADYNDLMQAVPKMKMPDYSAAIASGTYNLFDGFNYTAVKDCIIYIMIGCDSSQSYPSVSVNNNSLGYIWSNTSGIEFPLFIPLKAGDVLDVSATTQGNNWTENYIIFALS